MPSGGWVGGATSAQQVGLIVEVRERTKMNYLEEQGQMLPESARFGRGKGNKGDPLVTIALA